jgi:frataxin-like iron-binding protein CyaY
MFSKVCRSQKVASVLPTLVRRRDALISTATVAQSTSWNQGRTNFKFLESGRLFFSTLGDELPLLDESQFHEVADETLEELIDCLGKLEDSLDDFEVDLSVSVSDNRFYFSVSFYSFLTNCIFDSSESSQQGVLNISLTSKNVSWVINKQTPNRQLWWSSPIRSAR